MKKLIILSLIFASSYCYAGNPKALIDENSGKVISWGYVDFKPDVGQKVVENVDLGGKNCSDGLKYINGDIVSDPTLAIPKQKTLEERVSDLEKKVK